MKTTPAEKASAGVTRWAAHVLLGLVALVAVLGPIWEGRRRGAEAPAREYLAAVERGDLEAALATLAPDARQVGRERVERQLGNGYRVEGLVLGAPSIADRLLGRPRPPSWVHVAAEIRPAVGERWKSSSTAALIQQDGRWYLAAPLFA
jgi:hypothetical protein